MVPAPKNIIKTHDRDFCEGVNDANQLTEKETADNSLETIINDIKEELYQCVKPDFIQISLHQGTKPDVVSGFAHNKLIHESFKRLEGHEKWIKVLKCYRKRCFFTTEVANVFQLPKSPIGSLGIIPIQVNQHIFGHIVIACWAVFKFNQNSPYFKFLAKMIALAAMRENT